MTREEQKQRTRDAILFAARGLFVAKGYTATTVDAIARAAGVSRQGFYLHFRGKGSIVVEIMQSIGPEIAAAYQDLDGIEEPDMAKVRAWLDGHADLWRRYRMEFTAMEQALADEDEVAAAWYGFYGELANRMPRAMVSQLRAGASESLARARLTTAAMAVDRAFHFLILRGHAQDYDADATALAERLVTVLTR